MNNKSNEKNISCSSEKINIEEFMSHDSKFIKSMEEYSYRASPQNWFLRKISDWINKKEKQ
jgi:hypothetical protein